MSGNTRDDDRSIHTARALDADDGAVDDLFVTGKEAGEDEEAEARAPVCRADEAGEAGDAGEADDDEGADDGDDDADDGDGADDGGEPPEHSRKVRRRRRTRPRSRATSRPCS